MNELLNATFARLPNGHVCVILKTEGKIVTVRQMGTENHIKILSSELRKI